MVFVALNKENNKLIVATTKSEISRWIGISVDTIRRHLDNTSIYDTEYYTIWHTTLRMMRKRNNLPEPNQYNY